MDIKTCATVARGLKRNSAILEKLDTILKLIMQRAALACLAGTKKGTFDCECPRV